jgi:tetratricopeptide (TPR) repeat protein
MLRYPEFQVFARCLLFFFAVFALSADSADPNFTFQIMVSGGATAAMAKEFGSAEASLLKAVAVAEKFPAGDPRLGTALNTLGLVYREERKYSDAEKSFEKSLAILEKAYGPNSLDAGNINFNIASVLMAQAHYDNAVPYIERSQATFTTILGPRSLKSAATLCMIGEVYRYQKKYQAAEAPLKQCADVREATEGIESADLGDALYSLGLVYAQLGKYAIADSTLKLTEKIRERTAGVTSPELADALEAHSAVLKSLNRDSEAARDDALAAAIRRLEKKTK